MDINKLISQFLEETRLLEDEQTLAVIAYGSRIKQTNRATSDLDIAIFSSRIGNYKKGMVIDGIKIDCNIFSIDDLFSLAYQKRLVNNRYFDSILKTGIILKNQDETVEMFKQYLEEMADIKIKKKQVSKKFIHELTELYLQFQVTQNSIWYYVLLEKIRMCYHYKNNCSYLSMVKVYAIYKGYYSEEDIFQLPSSSFVNTFLLSVETDKLEERFQLLDELLQISGLKLNKDLEEDSLSEKFIQPNEIKQKLYVLHNKLLIIKEYLVTHILMEDIVIIIY